MGDYVNLYLGTTGTGGNFVSVDFGVVGSSTPALTSITPGVPVTQYDPATTLTCNGTFQSGDTIHVDGVAQATTFVDPATLTCTLPAGDMSSAVLAASGTKNVTVRRGVSESSPQTLTVNAWTPASLATGQQLWLSGGTGVTGSPVTAWADQFAGGRNFAGAGGSAPAAGTVNGLTVPDFDGADDAMTNATDVNTLIGSGGTTKFLVVAAVELDAIPDHGAAQYVFPGVLADANGYFGFGWHSHGGTNVVQTYLWTDGGGAVANYATVTIPGFSAPQKLVMMTWYDATIGSPVMTARVNNTTGTPVAPLPAANAGLNAAATTTVMRGYSTRYADGRVCELIVYSDTQTSGDRDRLVRYLATKFAIAL